MKFVKNNQEALLKQLKATGIAFALGGIMAAPNVFADNSASAFYDGDGGFAGAQALAGGASCTLDGWCKVLTTTLSNSGTPKDLVIGVSFETILMTETMVQSKGGKTSTATADAQVLMKVVVDNNYDYPAAPGVVTFDRRKQELWASLGGVSDCVDSNGDGIIQFDECTLTDEEIGLLLDTAQASTFNFLSYDIGSGSHTIDVWAQLTADGDVVTQETEDTGVRYSAGLGKGTLSVWEVHGAVSK